METKKFWLMMFMTVLLGQLFVACGDDDSNNNENNPQAKGKPYAVCTLTTESNSVKKGEMLNATVSLDPNLSSKGAKIKLVEFYLDNSSVGKSTSSPFKLSYTTNEVSVGTHTLSANITVGGDDYEDIMLIKESSITVTTAENQVPEVGFYGAFPSAGANGFTYHAWVYLDPNETSKGCKIKKVDYYWDDVFVTTATNSEGYALNVKLGDYNGAEGSTHTIKAIAQVGGDGYKDTEVSIEKYVNIVYDYSETWGVDLLLGNKRIIKNGENISCNIWQWYGKNSSPEIIAVNLYWDAVLVATDRLEIAGNSIVTYKIEGASIGQHKLTIESLVQEYNPKTDSYQVVAENKKEEMITIIE